MNVYVSYLAPQVRKTCTGPATNTLGPVSIGAFVLGKSGPQVGTTRQSG